MTDDHFPFKKCHSKNNPGYGDYDYLGFALLFKDLDFDENIKINKEIEMKNFKNFFEFSSSLEQYNKAGKFFSVDENKCQF